MTNYHILSGLKQYVSEEFYISEQQNKIYILFIFYLL